MRFEAIFATHPTVVTINETTGAFDKNGQQVTLDESIVQAKIAELEAAEPMRLLKEERNRRIAESDWRFLSDQTPSQAWIDYRQALRDLPANSTPELDEDGNLINVNWPEKPE
jgi:hypothetical protein